MAIKRRIRRLGLLLLAAFLVPAFQLWYYQVLTARALDHHRGNQRQLEDLNLRGSILDRSGRPLAITRGGRRRYPLGRAAAPLVGYCNRSLGVGGLELALDGYLRGRGRPRTLSQALALRRSRGRRGSDVVLTLDSDLQRKAWELLGGRTGAVVLLRVKGAAVLAAASCPGFDPGRVVRNWKKLRTDPDAPLVDRATQGMYPPGATFEVLMMSELLQNGLVGPDTTFTCHGKAHGRVSLSQALVHSCNHTFGRLGDRVGLATIDGWMRQLKLLDAPSDVPGAARGRLPLASARAAAVGQGGMLVTPLAMARLAALIARGGVDVEPRLIRAVEGPGSGAGPPSRIRRGRAAKTFVSPRRRLLKAGVVREVARAMRAVVARGTGTRASIPATVVAAMTGTAANHHPRPAAWFIGFAPFEHPRFAVAVVLENRGSGGTYAAPLAARMLEAALR